MIKKYWWIGCKLFKKQVKISFYQAIFCLFTFLVLKFWCQMNCLPNLLFKGRPFRSYILIQLSWLFHFYLIHIESLPESYLERSQTSTREFLRKMLTGKRRYWQNFNWVINTPLVTCWPKSPRKRECIFPWLVFWKFNSSSS